MKELLSVQPHLPGDTSTRPKNRDLEIVCKAVLRPMYSTNRVVLKWQGHGTF